MLDVETYLLTKDNPGGPIVVMKQIPLDEQLEEPVSSGVLIGRALGLLIIIGLGIYTCSIF